MVKNDENGQKCQKNANMMGCNRIFFTYLNTYGTIKNTCGKNFGRY